VYSLFPVPCSLFPVAIATSSVLNVSLTTLLALICAILLAIVHLFGGQMRFLDVIPRSQWLSFAGGASVAYVFVHLLPELNQGQRTIEQTEGLAIAFLESHVYLVALLGLTVFYGLEHLVKVYRQNQHKLSGILSQGIFWLHIGSFSLYNLLIGYLLIHREEPGVESLLFFFIAMALHFFVNDYGLRYHHQDAYHRVGRWVLAGAILCGWAIGQATEISPAALAVLFAFLGGGIILNVIKEELPEERQSRFWAFAVGATVYAGLLILG
jgi:zinc transporter ZupT